VVHVAIFGNKGAGAAMKVLLVSVLLAHLGTYMVVPLLPIFLKLQKDLTISEIGIVLAATPFALQAGSLLGGWLADRIGRRTVIVAGAWLNAAALAGYAWLDGLWILTGISLLSGLGIGLHAPSIKAAIAAIPSQQDQTLIFSYRGIAANIGIASAGLLTYFALGGPSARIFYIAAGLYLFIGAINGLLLSQGKFTQAREAALLRAYREVFRNRAFLVFSLAAILLWALYTQLTLVVPLRAETVLPNPGIVSLIWTVNSLIVIFVQTPLSKRFTAKVHPLHALAAGSFFLGAGLGSVYFSTHFYSLLFSGVLFIIGEMLIVPTIDATVSQLGTAQQLGLLFGITNFVAGLGESAGKYAGSRLLSLGGASSYVPYLVFVIAALAIAGMMMLLRRWKPMRSLN
jgi:hypothetical protein